TPRCECPYKRRKSARVRCLTKGPQILIRFSMHDLRAENSIRFVGIATDWMMAVGMACNLTPSIGRRIENVDRETMCAGGVVPEDPVVGVAPSRKGRAEFISRFVFDRVTVWVSGLGVTGIKFRGTGSLGRLVKRLWEGLLEFSLLVRVHDHRLNLACDVL